MDDLLLSLAQLADKSGIEPRTIRSYIERGLLPGAQSRGRGAGYFAEHLNRLRVIQHLRRLRPNATLNDIRMQLQHLTPQQIQAFAHGSITAAVLDGAIERTGGEDVDNERLESDADIIGADDQSPVATV